MNIIDGKSSLAASVRSSKVASFKVMDVLAKANAMESAGKSILHLEVGQPSSSAPKGALAASKKLLFKDKLGYTSAFGILPLRKRISEYYEEKYNTNVNFENVCVTMGSSTAFLIAFLSAFDQGDRVALASSTYPCYRNILLALGCEIVTIPINSEYKVTAKELQDYISKDTNKKPIKGIILSSPSNPTGAMLDPKELKDLCEFCDQSSIQFISDEIYHGITYGKKEETALKYSKNVIVINSFSKYFSMTGWRLGWMVIPERLKVETEKLSQNFLISAPTLSQMAAVDAFDCEEELEGHVARYTENRKIILDGIKEMGFTKKDMAPSDGAFYIYLDLGNRYKDSVTFCNDVLEQTGVALTPGIDFEDPNTDVGKKRIRFSFAGSTSDMKEAMSRMKKFLKTYKQK